MVHPAIVSPNSSPITSKIFTGPPTTRRLACCAPTTIATSYCCAKPPLHINSAPRREIGTREHASRAKPAGPLLRLAGLELRIVDDAQNIPERIAHLTDQHPAAYVLHLFDRRRAQLNQSLVSRMRVLHSPIRHARRSSFRFRLRRRHQPQVVSADVVSDVKCWLVKVRLNAQDLVVPLLRLSYVRHFILHRPQSQEHRMLLRSALPISRRRCRGRDVHPPNQVCKQTHERDNHSNRGNVLQLHAAHRFRINRRNYSGHRHSLSQPRPRIPASSARRPYHGSRA